MEQGFPSNTPKAGSGRLFTIRENREFKRAYLKGKSYVSPVMVTYVVKNRFRRLRVGITTSKKTGNAVERNRSRRVIREAYRSLLPELKVSRQGYDIVFVARGKTPFVKMQDVKKAMLSHFAKAGVVK